MAAPLADIGLIGLAVMGENLALNMESQGFRVAVFNRTVERSTSSSPAARGARTSSVRARRRSWSQSLKRPRKIMMLVKAGAAVDAVIDELLPLLEPGDILIDGGNSLFTDTIRRTKRVEDAGPAVHRHRRLRRRGRRAEGPVADARRQRGGVAARQADLPGRLRADAGRRAVLRLGRRGRRRPLREDGPQRHRVRRHAADLRSLRPDEARARPEQRRDARRLRASGTRASSTAT